jgi:hypothetical protein
MIETIKINEKYKNIKTDYNFEKKMETKSLFWQYPVITEKTFIEQHKTNSNYLGIPWANMFYSYLSTVCIFHMLHLSSYVDHVY